MDFRTGSISTSSKKKASRIGVWFKDWESKDKMSFYNCRRAVIRTKRVGSKRQVNGLEP